jgi:hypothetical protein
MGIYSWLAQMGRVCCCLVIATATLAGAISAHSVDRWAGSLFDDGGMGWNQSTNGGGLHREGRMTIRGDMCFDK